MKKIISRLLAFVLMLSMLLTFTSCFISHPIDKFKKRMDKENNYQISMTIYDVPVYGRMTMTAKKDGNIQYVKMLEEEIYMKETEDGTIYQYTKTNYGKWVKQKQKNEEDSSMINSEEVEDLFNSKSFEKVKGKRNKYKQKASVTFEDFDNVVITFEDDGCVIEMTYFIEGTGYDAKMIISKIGEIKLTLPTTI